MPHSTTIHDLINTSLANRRLLEHPFYKRWEEGKLTLEDLSEYASQYRHFERALPDILEKTLDNLPEGKAYDLIASNLHEEREVPIPHVELFELFADCLGAEAHDPSPATAYLLESYDNEIAKGATCSLGAIAAYEFQASDIARSKADGLKHYYGIDGPEAIFWEVHASMDRDHGAWTIEAMESLEDADLGSMAKSIDHIADAWWGFLDEREALAAQR
jgi:pyrroloquinoline-quinone synthase